jgi:hypothetical protein
VHRFASGKQTAVIEQRKTTACSSLERDSIVPRNCALNELLMKLVPAFLNPNERNRS